MQLAEQKCFPCERGAAAMTEDEAKGRLTEVPDWTLTDDGRHLERRFKLNDFMSVVRFIERIAHVSEEQGHHPDICFGWGYCNVTFQTHAAKGLTQNDFIMAAKVTEVFHQS
jgi:4a-hydroxytetrahydrobiopterin dehydratase